MNRSTIQVSNCLPLSKLLQIRANQYRGAHNRKGHVRDYDREAVDQAISSRKQAIGERLERRREIDMRERDQRCRRLIGALKRDGHMILGETLLRQCAVRIGECVKARHI